MYVGMYACMYICMYVGRNLGELLRVVAFVTGATMFGFGKKVVSFTEMKCQKCKQISAHNTPVPFVCDDQNLWNSALRQIATFFFRETGNSFSPCCGVRTKVGEPGAKPPNGPQGLHLALDMQTTVLARHNCWIKSWCQASCRDTQGRETIRTMAKQPHWARSRPCHPGVKVSRKGSLTRRKYPLVFPGAQALKRPSAQRKKYVRPRGPT